MQPKNNTVWIVLIVLAVLAVCCCVVVACLSLGVLTLGINAASTVIPDLTLVPPEITLVPPFDLPFDLPTQEPPVTFPTPLPPDSTSLNQAGETLRLLQQAVIPANDPRLLAERYKGMRNIPETLPAPPDYNPGDETQFWVTNVGTNETRQANFVLAYETSHTYIWVEKGVQTNAAAVKNLAETFENKIYPTNRNFFGSEWTPGIDNDPHIYIVYARDLSNSIAGYFSSSDSIPPQAHPYSNGHESFYLNADTLALDGEAFSTLAHEFQHMIHHHRDPNETSWMNEGFAVLAEMLNGYDTGGFDYAYASQPDQSLNDWPNDQNEIMPYYGSSFLYLAYFLDRFGEDATKALVAEQENSLDSVDAVMKNLAIQDPQTGVPINADDLFADWVVTNYLLDGRVADGRYQYHNYADAPRTGDTEQISTCNGGWQDRSVNQYGVDYIRLSCSGAVTLNLEGVQEVGVLPVGALSGDYAFWSNKGDDSDIALTREFDLTQASGPLTFTYNIWYDIEKDYDYVYLAASTNGEQWEIIKTSGCSEDNLSGNNYGCGYNGVSDGWVEETVDISRFAGQKLTLRFEYITDGAVNGEGLLLDNVSLPALNYASDFEQDDGGWQADGFVRIQNRLPQTYRVSVIREGSATQVQSFALQPGQPLSLSLDFGSQMRDAVLVVSGTTRYTRQPALYRFRLQP